MNLMKITDQNILLFKLTNLVWDNTFQVNIRIGFLITKKTKKIFENINNIFTVGVDEISRIISFTIDDQLIVGIDDCCS